MERSKYGEPWVVLPAVLLLVLSAQLASAQSAVPENHAVAESQPAEDIESLPDAASVFAPPAKNPDPWIGMNRGIWAFNDGLDKAILSPIARGYRAVMPDLLEEGVSNFFDNLQVPATALNQILQGKPGAMFSDIGRFALNSTAGVLGIFDVATRAGLAQHDEDFGQTLAVWGVAQGPYFMIPIRGPSTVTAAAGMIVDGLTNPIGYINDVSVRNVTLALYFLDLRKRLLAAEVLVSGDEYLFVRDAYLQRRDYLISDGQVEEDPFMDDFEDF